MSSCLPRSDTSPRDPAADQVPTASAISRSLLLTQRSKARAHFLRQKLRLLPAGEVSAPGQRVVVNQVGVGLLGPTPWSRIEFVRKDAHGNRDGDAFHIEIP